MTELWDNLNARERGLIMIAASLLAVLLVLLLVIRPLIGYRLDSRAAFHDAAETLVLVNRASASPAETEASDPAALRSILTRTAGRSGIVITRINSQNAMVDISVGDTTTARLFDWLALLESQHSIYVYGASMRPNMDGRSITARLTVAKGA